MCNRLIYANCKSGLADAARPHNVTKPGANARLRSNKATNQPNEPHAGARKCRLMRRAPYVALTTALTAFLYVP